MMEKFIVRTRRSEDNGPNKPSTSKTPMRQATIDSLKGVVVIEEVKRLKCVLRTPNQTKLNLLEALDALEKKIPPRHILQETKIGHTVNRLTTHDDSEVSQKAAVVVKSWKKFFEDKLDKPLIEVKCDRRTGELREAGRKHILRSLNTPDEPPDSKRLAEAIEREMFLQHKRLVDKGYRRSMRALVFSLQHQDKLRSSVLSGEMQIQELVARHRKEMLKKT